MSLLNPAALWMLGLAAPLLALYFLKLRRQRVEVPSTLLWREFLRTEQLATPFQRFRRNLLLLLQLLILVLLALALARPYLAGRVSRERSVVIVVDSSASMNATDVRPSRFAAAVEAARDVVDGLEGGDEAMIVEAGPRTRVVASFSRDKDRLRRALGSMRATEAEGSLRDALALALSLSRERPDRQIVVLSDGSGESLDDLALRAGAVQYVRIGRSAANAGITALDLRRSPVSELDHQLFVTVENFGVEATTGRVEVFLEEELTGRQELTLDPGQAAPLVFDLAGGGRGTLRVELRVQGDDLPTDDVAYALLQPTERRRVLAVGVNALALKVLALDPRLEVDVIAPESYSSSAGYDCTVFDGFFPDTSMDGLSYLVLSPPPPGTALPVRFGEQLRAPRVLNWKRDHDVLRFVDLSDLAVARASAVVDDGTLATLVEADTGPLVLGGERHGGRVLVLAFDPLRSDLPLRVAFPVMMLNAVSWMTRGVGRSEGGALVSTGATFTYPVAGASEVRVRTPDGENLSVGVGGGMLRFGQIDRVGVYQVELPDERVGFAANLASRRESMIAPMKDLGLGADVAVRAAGAAAGRREIWRELCLAAVGLLLLEWFVWNRRRSG